MNVEDTWNLWNFVQGIESFVIFVLQILAGIGLFKLGGSTGRAALHLAGGGVVILALVRGAAVAVWTVVPTMVNELDIDEVGDFFGMVRTGVGCAEAAAWGMIGIGLLVAGLAGSSDD